MDSDAASEIIAKGLAPLVEHRAQMESRLIEAKAVMEKYVKSEANAEMMTVFVRTLETMMHGEPKTPMRKHHHE